MKFKVCWACLNGVQELVHATLAFRLRQFITGATIFMLFLFSLRVMVQVLILLRTGRMERKRYLDIANDTSREAGREQNCCVN